MPWAEWEAFASHSGLYDTDGVPMRTLFPLASILTATTLAGAQHLDLEVDPMVIEEGDLVTVEVRVDGAIQDLRGFSVDLYFDPSRVQPQNVFEGEVLLAHPPTFFYWEERDDAWGHSLHVDNAILGGNMGASGPGALCYILLRGESCGLESLRLEHAVLRDMDNQNIPVTVGPAITHQICLVPPLFIENQVDGSIRLSWLPSLNAEEYHLWSRDGWSQPWQYRVATMDTTWTDPETPFLGKRFYQMTLLQHP